MEKYTVFKDFECLGCGTLQEVAAVVAQTGTGQTGGGVLVFCDATGAQTDIGVNYPAEKTKGRGRPRLGVVPREVTLLPRHWDWLNSQPGGASVALRRLIDEARKDPKEDQRRAKDAVYRIITSLCGDMAGYEEAVRALYADEGQRFYEYVRRWPEDVRLYIERVSEETFNE
ncbi:MAG: DUF2239 family protein [Deferribacterales bacterium]